MIPTPTHLKLGWLRITKVFAHVLLYVLFYIRVNTQYDAWESGATFISRAVLRYTVTHPVSQPSWESYSWPLYGCPMPDGLQESLNMFQLIFSDKKSTHTLS